MTGTISLWGSEWTWWELKMLVAISLVFILVGCALTLYDWIEHKESRGLPPLAETLIFIGVGGLAVLAIGPLFFGLGYLIALLLLPFGLGRE